LRSSVKYVIGAAGAAADADAAAADADTDAAGAAAGFEVVLIITYLIKQTRRSATTRNGVGSCSDAQDPA